MKHKTIYRDGNIHGDMIGMIYFKTAGGEHMAYAYNETTQKQSCIGTYATRDEAITAIVGYHA